MCLITDNKEKLIAGKDMIVYKSLTPNLKSLYNFFQYIIDKEYKTVIKESTEWCSFDDMDTAFLDKNFGNNWNKEKPEGLFCFGSGFHSAKSAKRLIKESESGGVIFKCIIPKGAEYVKGFTELVVSNKIIIKKMISDKELERSVATKINQG